MLAHMLLGLLREPNGIGRKIIDNYLISSEAIEEKIDMLTQRGLEVVSGSKLALTPRAKKVLEIAEDVMETSGDDCVNSGHLLIGLVEEKNGVASVVLNSFGITCDSVKASFVSLQAKTKRSPRSIVQEMVEEQRKAIEDNDYEKAALLREQINIVRNKIKPRTRETVFEKPTYHVVENVSGMFDIIEFEKEYPEDGHVYLAMTPNKDTAQFIVDKLNGNS